MSTLPEFCKNGETTDISQATGLIENGFVPNTPIISSEMNAYLKMLSNALSGLVSYADAGKSSSIEWSSTIKEWSDYFKSNLDAIIKNSVALNATALSDGDGNLLNVGDGTTFVHFKNGKPIATTADVANDYSLMHMKSGSLTKSTKTIGNARTPVYLFNGSITKCSISQYHINGIAATSVGSMQNAMKFDLNDDSSHGNFPGGSILCLLVFTNAQSSTKALMSKVAVIVDGQLLDDSFADSSVHKYSSASGTYTIENATLRCKNDGASGLVVDGSISRMSGSYSSTGVQSVMRPILISQDAAALPTTLDVYLLRNL